MSSRGSLTKGSKPTPSRKLSSLLLKWETGEVQNTSTRRSSGSSFTASGTGGNRRFSPEPITPSSSLASNVSSSVRERKSRLVDQRWGKVLAENTEQTQQGDKIERRSKTELPAGLVSKSIDEKNTQSGATENSGSGSRRGSVTDITSKYNSLSSKHDEKNARLPESSSFVKTGKDSRRTSVTDVTEKFNKLSSKSATMQGSLLGEQSEVTTIRSLTALPSKTQKEQSAGHPERKHSFQSTKNNRRASDMTKQWDGQSADSKGDTNTTNNDELEPGHVGQQRQSIDKEERSRDEEAKLVDDGSSEAADDDETSSEAAVKDKSAESDDESSEAAVKDKGAESNDESTETVVNDTSSKAVVNDESDQFCEEPARRSNGTSGILSVNWDGVEISCGPRCVLSIVLSFIVSVTNSRGKAAVVLSRSCLPGWGDGLLWVLLRKIC